MRRRYVKPCDVSWVRRGERENRKFWVILPVCEGYKEQDCVRGYRLFVVGPVNAFYIGKQHHSYHDQQWCSSCSRHGSEDGVEEGGDAKQNPADQGAETSLRPGFDACRGFWGNEDGWAGEISTENGRETTHDEQKVSSGYRTTFLGESCEIRE